MKVVKNHLGAQVLYRILEFKLWTLLKNGVNNIHQGCRADERKPLKTDAEGF